MSSSNAQAFPAVPAAMREVLLGHSPGEAIALTILDGELRIDSLHFRGPVSVSLDLVPSPIIRLRGSLEPVGTGEALFSKQRTPGVVLSYPGGKKPIPLLLTESSWRLSGPIAITATTRNPTVTLDTARAPTGLTFLLLNQAFTPASTMSASREGDAHPTLTMSFDRWTVWIWARPDLNAVIQRTKALGSFAVTHGGLLARADSSSFSEAEAATAIDALFWSFSFARGLWSGPMIQRFTATEGDVVGEIWEAPKLDPWLPAHSWLPDPQAFALSHVTAAVYSRLSDETWAEPLRLAIHWYISANKQDGGIEGSLVLQQAALELLAWTHLVEATAGSSKGAFDRLSAVERVRELLSELKLSAAIPTAVTYLSACAAANGWTDVPQAIVALRNDVVHPQKKTRLSNAIVNFEAWQVGQSLLEQAILRILNYSGPSSDRVGSGTLEVPGADV